MLGAMGELTPEICAPLIKYLGEVYKILVTEVKQEMCYVIHTVSGTECCRMVCLTCSVIDMAVCVHRKISL